LDIRTQSITSAMTTDLLSDDQLTLVRSRLHLPQNDPDNISIILATLRDIDGSSLRSPALLSYFIQDLVGLFGSFSAEIRNITFTLLLRLLHYSPRCLVLQELDILKNKLGNQL